MSLADRYRRPADLPPRIPLFPLRGAILLPGSTLPLNIFEPRYLEMIEDVMSGSRMLGMIQPVGSDAQESPPERQVELRRIGGAGRITSYQELDDGRLAIAVTGISRFEIVGEAETGKSYRAASVSYDRFASDLTRGFGEERIDRVRLIGVLRSYLTENNLQTDWAVIDRAPSEYLINALCVMCPYGPEEKQALLEASDLKTRAEVLVALAEMDLAARGGSGGTLQ
ncbi:LON peptidase substrate-binding domain-containing protein [Hyphomicrobium sp.]|uniref:LON peptidase substrate-binding domain-containing protein n=1 Tax=Hyphomicrobium sp. TaxID=82 RepID=UPI003F6EA01E